MIIDDIAIMGIMGFICASFFILGIIRAIT